MRTLALAVAVLALPALAEEELGLDLTEEEVPEEFRPALAVVGVSAVAGAEDREVNRAKLLDAELIRQVQASSKYGRVLLPAQVAETLGADAAAAKGCAELACLKALAEKLGVQRVITGTVAKAASTSLLTVFGFDTTQPAVMTTSAESGEKAEKQLIGGFSGIGGKSQAQKDKDFVKKSVPAFADMLNKLATPLAKLVVDCFENTAETRLNGQVVGKGSFSILVPHGSYKLATLGEGFLPFEKDLKLESMKVESVRVTLVAKPLDKPLAAAAAARREPTVFERPGFYIAVAGVVAVGVAAALGASTLGVTDKDSDGDGVLDVSRAQVKSARGAAVAADVLYVAGGAMILGGGLWVLLAPARKTSGPAPAGPRPTDEPDSGPSGGMMFMLGASGRF